MIWTLIIAWILTWFDIDQIVVNAINQILNTDYILVDSSCNRNNCMF